MTFSLVHLLFFFTQSKSFLEYQHIMEAAEGRNNARSIFKIGRIPTDNHVRSLLDNYSPTLLYPIFDKLLVYLQEQRVLDSYRHVNNTLLLALDGVHYYSSYKLSCPNCNTRKKDDQTLYTHSMVSSCLVKPGSSEVIPLSPAFIKGYQDKHKQTSKISAKEQKQDCEREAAKEWLKAQGSGYADLGVTLLGDALYGCESICKLSLLRGFNFIFNCKPGSHKTLFEFVEPMLKLQEIPEIRRLITSSKGKRIWKISYVNGVPIKDGKNALNVNWCRIAITDKVTGKLTYTNTFITNHKITDSNVFDIVTAGRTRWKIENEHNNTLKNHGYHLEHNFGHGKNNLSAFLATLILLSFLSHTILKLLDIQYQAVANNKPRSIFFNRLKGILELMYFVDWYDLIEFMEPLSKRRSRSRSA